MLYKKYTGCLSWSLNDSETIRRLIIGNDKLLEIIQYFNRINIRGLARGEAVILEVLFFGFILPKNALQIFLSIQYDLPL